MAPGLIQGEETDPAVGHTIAERAEAFFQALAQNRVTEAYTGLMEGSEMADDTDQIQLLHDRTREAIELFGPIRGYDYLGADRVGGHLVRANFLSLGERFPLRWRLYFYRVRDDWRLIDIRVDDGITEMFDDPNPAQPRRPTP